MEERYIADALGNTPQKDPELVLEVLYNIWVSTLTARPHHVDQGVINAKPGSSDRYRGASRVSNARPVTAACAPM